jgi:hypothetical protein
MTFIDYLVKNEKVSLNGIIPWLHNIYMNDHNWKSGEMSANVAEMKRDYVDKNVLIYGLCNNIIDGKLIYVPFTNDYGMPHIDVMGEEITGISYNKSYVIVVSLINFVANDISDKYLIPVKLLIHAGIEVPNNRSVVAQVELDEESKRELEALRSEKIKWDAAAEKVASTETERDAAQEDEGMLSEKMSLMWQYAFDIGVFCKENSDDDYISIFDDVSHYLAIKYGKEVVPDSWVREILDYAPKGLSNKGGSPRKILTDAIKAGFYMRDWFNGDEKISEPDFNNRFKKLLPKASSNVRAKAWKCLNDIRYEKKEEDD